MAKPKDEGGAAVLDKPLPTDETLHAQSQPKPLTDADLHARLVEREAVHVNVGDLIVHMVMLKSPSGATCWLKAPSGTSTTLSRHRNILAVALEPFTYISGEGRSSEDVRYREVRKWIEPFRLPPTRDPATGKMVAGQVMQGGDMVVFDESTGKAPPEIKNLMDPPLPEGGVMKTRKADAVPGAIA
jgi:hypothetical protein